MNDLGLAPRVPRPRAPLDRVVARGDHEVCLEKPRALGIPPAKPDRHQGLRVVRRQDVLGHEGIHHRDPRPLGEEAELSGRAAADDAVARQDERALGLVEECCGPGQRWPIGRGAPGPFDGERLALRRLLSHVLGQLDVAGSRLLLLRQLEGLPHDL